MQDCRQNCSARPFAFLAYLIPLVWFIKSFSREDVCADMVRNIKMENESHYGLITVIVPVYNVGEYLNRCIKSIVCQSYQRLEIILVDDGSTDSSSAICDEWALRDLRIKVIHKENGGLSSARNAGLAVAKGEYILFVDSDDWLELEMIETLLGIMSQFSVDIVECNWKVCSDDEPFDIESQLMAAPAIYDAGFAIGQIMVDGIFRQTVVNKLYKREIIGSELFPEGKVNEDEFWTYRVFMKAKKLSKVEVSFYHYFKRPGSIIQSEYSLKRLDGVEAKKRRLIDLKEAFPELYPLAVKSYFFACRYSFQKICQNVSLDQNREIRSFLLDDYRRYFKKYWQISGKGDVDIWCYIFAAFPYITANVRNWLGIGL